MTLCRGPKLVLILSGILATGLIYAVLAIAVVPTITVEQVSGLTSTDVKLEAAINPNLLETGYHFEYSTEATGETLEGTVTSVEGAPPLPLLEAVSELKLAGPVDLKGALHENVTYFYRVVAQNESGEVKGAVQSFQTLALPTATTGGASGVSRTTAALSGSVNPGGAATSYSFAYIEQSAYEAAIAEKAKNPYANGVTTPQSSSVGEDRTLHAVGPAPISELRPGTTYHYALVAGNSVGTTIDKTGATFTTSAPTPPTAVTGGALEIGQSTAVLQGTLDTRGLPTSYQFELGTQANSYFPQTFAGATTAAGAQAVALQLSYLAAGTSYHYRLCVTNPDGTVCGGDATFATLGVANPLSLPATPPVLAIPAESHPRSVVQGTTTKGLTRAQKLANALKACRKKPKRQRAGCERQARRRYGTAKTKHKSHK